MNPSIILHDVSSIEDDFFGPDITSFKEQLKTRYPTLKADEISTNNDITNNDSDDDYESWRDPRLPTFDEMNQLNEIYKDAKDKGILDELLERLRKHWGYFEVRPNVDDVRNFSVQLQAEKNANH
ncbi:Hypothetical protein HVR_LOCUS873 [uncultured virus]|nr:Hypothetical protein HVR_LOCUS873 [uncultured virus]